jgi:hypothetical protein
VDLVTSGSDPVHPITPEDLRVFPQDSDLPADSRNARIDQEFVPMPKPEVPKEGAFAAWKANRIAKLMTLTFHHFPGQIPTARPVQTNSSGLVWLETEPGISVPLRKVQSARSGSGRLWLIASTEEQDEHPWWKQFISPQDDAYVFEPRGIGETRWTRKNPPNYVERAHYLLGRTVDSGRVWDLVAVARYVREIGHGRNSVCLAGEGPAGALAAYAALLEPGIDEIFLFHPPSSHMESSAPALLNVLRVCDVPEAVGMLAPRLVSIVSDLQAWRDITQQIYSAAGAPEKLSLRL